MTAESLMLLAAFGLFLVGAYVAALAMVLATLLFELFIGE